MIKLKLIKCSEEHYKKSKSDLEPLDPRYEKYIKNLGLHDIAINSIVEIGNGRRIFYKEVPFNTKPYMDIRYTQHYIKGTENMYVLMYTNVTKIELDRNPTCIASISKLHKGKFNLMCSDDIKKSLDKKQSISSNLDVTSFLKIHKDTWGLEVFDTLLASTVCNFEERREYLLLDFLETFMYIRR